MSEVMNIFKLSIIVGIISISSLARAMKTFEIETQDTHGGWNYYYFCNAPDEVVRLESARFQLDRLANEKCNPSIAKHLETTFFDYSCTDILPEGFGTYQARISGIYICE